MATLDKRYPYYLANRPVAANADLDVLDKYSGKRATRVALADATAVRKAIVAAHKAREAMAAFPPDARRDVLEHCVHRFSQRAEELARVLCIEAGKPIKDARGEVARLIDTFRIAAGEATRIGGEVIELQISPRTRGYRGMTRRVPVGVCSFITPFNFPLNLVAHKVAPAIAAGCPFVLKPAAKTPVGALIIAEVLAETQLPRGAFSVLPCSNENAAQLVEDERIALLSFTGGLVGWDLKARAGRKREGCGVLRWQPPPDPHLQHEVRAGGDASETRRVPPASRRRPGESRPESSRARVVRAVRGAVSRRHQRDGKSREAARGFLTRADPRRRRREDAGRDEARGRQSAP